MDYVSGLMFPDTADISYRVTGQHDPSGGPLASYRPGPTGVACSRQDAQAVEINALRALGEKVDSSVWFSAAGPAAADVGRLKRGDLLTFPGPVVQEVVRADSMGIGGLQLWQVYTRRRE